MESGGNRRRRSQSDEKPDSPNLRDFLRVKDDDDSHTSLAGLTLSAVLGEKKRPPPAQVNRTLLDVIRDDPNTSKESRKSWKAFKEKLRLRRAGAAWTSTVPIPTSDIPIQNSNRMISRRNSTRCPPAAVNSNDPTPDSTHPDLSSSSISVNGREISISNSLEPGNRAMMLRRNSSRVPSLASGRHGWGSDEPASMNTRATFQVEEEEDEEEAEEGLGEAEAEEDAEGEEEGEEPPVRMSLMALLAETDYMVDDDEEEEDEEEEETAAAAADTGEYNNCCVCMVRHKGAAFIPCGHTFCRLCSRELWVQRGNCPLCNGFILEILDIF